MIDLNRFSPARLKIALIVVPVLLAALYFYVIAANRYVSISTVALREAGNDNSAMPGGAAMLLAAFSPPSRDDTLYLKQYMTSLNLLQRLDARLGLRKHYEAEKLDLPIRLWGGTTQERFLDYYRNRVELILDDQSSTITLRVQGFSADFAKRLNEAILDESEIFVNELSHKLAREKLQFAQGEMAHAAEKVQQAKAEVLTFQSKNSLLDPLIQAQASGSLSAEMQASITRSEAELRQLRTYLNDDSYQVRALRSQIEATRAQIALEGARATGSGKNSDRLGALAIEFQGLQMKADFALDGYKLALAAVENARIEASRKLKSFVVIEPPTLPEQAELPRSTYDVLTTLVACLLLYGVARLVIATIREHQD